MNFKRASLVGIKKINDVGEACSAFYCSVPYSNEIANPITKSTIIIMNIQWHGT